MLAVLRGTCSRTFKMCSVCVCSNVRILLFVNRFFSRSKENVEQTPNRIPHTSKSNIKIRGDGSPLTTQRFKI